MAIAWRGSRLPTKTSTTAVRGRRCDIIRSGRDRPSTGTSYTGLFPMWKIQSVSCSTAANIASRCSRSPLVSDAPDRAVTVLRDQERAVARDRDADRASPHIGIAGDKAGHEVLIFAGRNAVLHTDADHLIARALRTIPGAVLGGKAVAAIFRRECAAFVERQPERGRMRLDQDVWNGVL